jgi:tagatose 6-phosphate kinase
VGSFQRGETARVGWVGRRAGGKGVNVARVLHALGHEVAVTGFAGGFTGAAARSELERSGIADRTVDFDSQSRLAVMVVEDDGTATGFSEPGGRVSPEDWQALIARCRALLGEARAVVISGSVPPGVPEDGYGQLVAAARQAGVPALLDADGVALARALAARPDIVKINRAELRGLHPDEDLVPGALRMREAGAGEVVVTDGPRGMSAVTAEGVLHLAPPQELRGNPTGAGDAAAAAMILGLLEGTPWPERLREATALSAAAVCAPMAGSFDARVYERLRRELPIPGTHMAG